MGRAASTLYVSVSQFPNALSPGDPSTRAATLYSNVLRSSASKRAHLWKGQRVRSSRLTRQLHHWTRRTCSGMSPGVAVDGVVLSEYIDAPGVYLKRLRLGDDLEYDAAIK